ncbi:MAG: hypothetical protein KF809_08525 [Chloroflexi bacterium]|nr:hypothetical protein [Chloroflexota bacterium]
MSSRAEEAPYRRTPRERVKSRLLDGHGLSLLDEPQGHWATQVVDRLAFIETVGWRLARISLHTADSSVTYVGPTADTFLVLVYVDGTDGVHLFGHGRFAGRRPFEGHLGDLADSPQAAVIPRSPWRRGRPTVDPAAIDARVDELTTILRDHAADLL